MEANNKVVAIKLSNYVKPEVQENNSRNYVLNGIDHKFYKYIVDRYMGSATNRAIVDAFSKYIYGKGLVSTSPQLAQVKKIIPKNELRGICADFKTFGSACAELIYAAGKLVKVKHASRVQIAPEKMDPLSGEINNYYFCQDFSKPAKYKPIKIAAWKPKGLKNGSYIFEFRTHTIGRTYFSDPDYLAGLQYAELEEEICNYFVSHIKNGLSTGYILNMNGGLPDEETRRLFEAQFKAEASGSSNAGNVIVNWNSGKDTAIDVQALSISDAHSQYNEINTQCTQKLLIAHKVTSPILFGIKDNTGFGNNAQEMETAFNELMLNVIQPMQEVILDGLMELLSDAGIQIDLDFIPLRTSQAQPTQLSLSSQEINFGTALDELIELGEEAESEDWELVDEAHVHDNPTLGEFELNTAAKGIQLAKTFSSFPNAASEQDTSLFKIRYQYAGNANPEREFCQKLMKANKVYRAEDIQLAETKVVNPGLGLNGADTYSIWLYKGGVNCNHFWLRKIYMKRNNASISVNEARRIINSLDPSKRPAAKWEQNDPLVAQSADASNNYFRAK